MSTNSYLQLGTIEALVVRKPIKNLHLSVLPPNGWVRVTAPAGMKDDAIRTLLALRLPWIKKQQIKFFNQERQTKREFVFGESHYFLGRRYRLEVSFKNATQKVYVKGGNKIILQVRQGNTTEKRKEIMMEWYRKELRPIIEELVYKWEQKTGVKSESWSIRQMKTRWGTCNHKTGKLLFNLELAKKPINCIEYVVVHELLHLVENKHNKNFVDLMEKYLPKWQSIKNDLNSCILSFEEWKY